MITPKSKTDRRYAYITIPDGSLTTPTGSPKILIHTRQGKIVGIYCDQPAKILEVETQNSPKRAADPWNQAFLSVISPRQPLPGFGNAGVGLSGRTQNQVS